MAIRLDRRNETKQKNNPKKTTRLITSLIIFKRIPEETIEEIKLNTSKGSVYNGVSSSAA